MRFWRMLCRRRILGDVTRLMSTTSSSDLAGFYLGKVSRASYFLLASNSHTIMDHFTYSSMVSPRSTAAAWSPNLESPR